jgi:hypothetical protein
VDEQERRAAAAAEVVHPWAYPGGLGRDRRAGGERRVQAVAPPDDELVQLGPERGDVRGERRARGPRALGRRGDLAAELLERLLRAPADQVDAGQRVLRGERVGEEEPQQLGVAQLEHADLVAGEPVAQRLLARRRGLEDAAGAPAAGVVAPGEQAVGLQALELGVDLRRPERPEEPHGALGRAAHVVTRPGPEHDHAEHRRRGVRQPGRSPGLLVGGAMGREPRPSRDGERSRPALVLSCRRRQAASASKSGPPAVSRSTSAKTAPSRTSRARSRPSTSDAASRPASSAPTIRGRDARSPGEEQAADRGARRGAQRAGLVGRQLDAVARARVASV